MPLLVDAEPHKCASVTTASSLVKSLIEVIHQVVIGARVIGRRPRAARKHRDFVSSPQPTPWTTYAADWWEDGSAVSWTGQKSAETG